MRLLYRANEVAQLLNVSRRTIDRMIQSGQLIRTQLVTNPHAKHQPIRIRAESVLALIQGKHD